MSEGEREIRLRGLREMGKIRSAEQAQNGNEEGARIGISEEKSLASLVQHVGIFCGWEFYF